jgi:hypothetical protein
MTATLDDYRATLAAQAARVALLEEALTTILSCDRLDCADCRAQAREALAGRVAEVYDPMPALSAEMRAGVARLSDPT